MNRLFALLIAIAVLPLCFTSCETADHASSLILPDRDEEGFTGPGIRIADAQSEMNTNRVDQLTRTEYAPSDYLRKQQQQPVDGIDFFQYKQKF